MTSRPNRGGPTGSARNGLWDRDMGNSPGGVRLVPYGVMGPLRPVADVEGPVAAREAGGVLSRGDPWGTAPEVTRLDSCRHFPLRRRLIGASAARSRVGPA